jgi:6-methylsalicylate decarboxylase
VPYLAGRVSVTASMLADLKGAAPALADGVGKLYSMSHKLEEKMPDQLSYYLRFKNNVLPEGPDYFLSRFYYDTALSASPHCFSALLTVTDSAHIVFGTDYVFATGAAVPATINGVRNNGFAPDDVRAIERETALTLLPGLR